MARLGIEDLRYPGSEFSIAAVPAPAPGRTGKARHNFETRKFCRREDLKRAKGCRRVSSAFVAAAASEQLAERLRGGVTPRTLASSRYMRRVRIRVIGHLWKLLVDGPWDVSVGEQVAVVTIVPRCWEFTPAQLERTRAEQPMEQLRTWLNRAGAPGATGFLLACLHGEFEPNRCVFRLHVHGVAAGGMIGVVDQLRKHSELDPKLDPSGGLKNPPPRVEISRKPISNIVYTLTYQLKSYWPSVWMGVVEVDGEMRRSRRKQRIAEPHHTQLLLWLDRHRLRQITLLMKLRVGKQGLVPIQPTAQTASHKKD